MRGSRKDWQKEPRLLELAILACHRNHNRCEEAELCVFEQSKGETTMETAWTILLWSFECLFTGTWPARNWDGSEWAPDSAEAALAAQPLAEGFFGVVYVLLGDWEFFSKTYGMKRHNAIDMCEFLHIEQACDDSEILAQ